MPGKFVGVPTFVKILRVDIPRIRNFKKNDHKIRCKLKKIF